MCKLRIEQYFQVQDYALWDVIENGNYFKPVTRTTTNADGTSTSTILGPVTTEEKAQNKNDVKARSMLLMALPKEHLLKFSQHKDANTLFEAIQGIFGGNDATKKTQKTLLKQITVTTSSSSGSQNMAFVSTPGNTNKVNTANVQVSTASTLISTTSTNDNSANLTNPYEDDLEEIDLKWQLALLSMRAKRSLRNQESRPRNQDSSKRTVNVEDTSFNAMVAIDGTGFDWSFMADEEVPTNLALMAFSDSENNEVMFYDQIAVLKRDASFKDSKINALNIQIEKLKKEKESNQIKIDNFVNASRILDKLIGSQITDKGRKGVGFESYNVVAPLPTGLFAPPTIDLSSFGLKEFQQLEFEGYGTKVSDSDEDEFEVMVSDNVQHKPKQANQPRKVSQNHRNNKTNWNEKKTQKLGVGFKFIKKACFVCGSFNYLIKDCDFHDKKMVQKSGMNNVKKGTSQREVRPLWNNAMRTNHQNFSNSRRNFTSTAVLTKSGIIPISTARQSSSRAAASVSAARPINTTAPKPFVNVAKHRPNAF
ncbi:hypothetical protein Tco_0453641 [Tanacetum coccineum]